LVGGAPLFGVEARVPDELISRTVKMVGSRPYVLNRHTGGAAVLRVIIRSQHLEFADQIGRLRKIQNRTGQSLYTGRVEQANAIHNDDAGLRLATIYVRAGDITGTAGNAGEQRSKIRRRTD